MVRKISSIVLSLAILTSGYFAWKKLSYWERSVMIFSYDPDEQQFGRGMGRGPGRFEGRPGRELPDSILIRFEQNRERPQIRREGGDFHGGRQGTGKKINLRNLPLYLAIFASFAVIIIYIEKGIKFIRKKKADVQVPSQKQQQDCGIDE